MRVCFIYLLFTIITAKTIHREGKVHYKLILIIWFLNCSVDNLVIKFCVCLCYIVCE